MKKLILTVLAAIVICCNLTVYAADTVYVNSAGDLYDLSERVANGDAMDEVTVILQNDITLTEKFDPIGSDPTHPFSGIFDGNGHVIKGLRVEGGSYLGLFGCITDGTVKNLTLTDAYVSGEDYLGLLAGRVYGYKDEAVIENCTVKGKVQGNCYAGAVAGILLAAAYDNGAEAYIKNCTAYGNTSGNMYVGGIAGMAEARGNSKTASAYVNDCTSHGTVTAKGTYGTAAGGICGALSAKDNGGNATAEVDGCVSFAAAKCDKIAAGGAFGTVGAVGDGAMCAVSNCKAMGFVSGSAVVGGFCGKAETDNAIVAFENNIAAGCIISTDGDGIGFGEIESGCTRPDSAEGLSLADYGKGDVNLDGRTDSLDAAILLKLDAALGIPSPFCDVNGDGKLDSLDAARILKYDALLIDEL